MFDDEFQITLPSNTTIGDAGSGAGGGAGSSVGLYNSTNTPALFKTKLPFALNLEGEWEVALVDIQYSRNWNNITMEEYLILDLFPEEHIYLPDLTEVSTKVKLRYRDNKVGQDLIDSWENYKTEKEMPAASFPLQIPAAYYASPADLADVLNTQINEILNVPEVRGVFTPALEFQMIFDPILKQTRFSQSGLKRFAFGTATTTLGDILGIPSTKIEGPPLLYYYQPNVMRPKTGTIEQISSMYIYCDLIKYQMVGDTQAPLLGVLPVQGSYGEQIFWGFNPPYYIPLNKQHIDSITIRICTDTGDEIPFNPKGKSVCRLHFRRKRGAAASLW